MDSKERREAPTDFQLRTKYRLELRSKAIQKVLWSKRIPQGKNQDIKGYDLSKYCHKRKFKIKKCWDCGSACHLKANCQSIKSSNSERGSLSLKEESKN